MGFLDKILGSGIQNVVEGIGNIADKFITSPDEKKAFSIEVEKLAQEKSKAITDAAQTELDSLLKDTANARDMNVKVQESSNASWLSKNIAYCLDGFVGIIWGTTTVYLLVTMMNIIKKDPNVDYTAVAAIWGGISTTFGLILNFHRGSSRGSEKSSDTLRSLATAK